MSISEAPNFLNNSKLESQGTTRQVIDAARFTDDEIEQRGAWLGGLFEVGGSLGLFTNYLRRRTYQSFPFISLADSYEGVIDKLVQRFGGKKYQHGPGKWQWIARGTKGRVLLLANAMMPFAPSRTEMIIGIQNWEQADLEERVQIAKDLKGYDRVKTLQVDTYDDLVKRPAFVAGVFDGRAAPYSMRHRDEVVPEGFWVSEQVNIYSENRPLLEALRTDYGGAVIESPHYHWQIGKRDTSKLLPIIQEHLLLVQVANGRLLRS